MAVLPGDPAPVFHARCSSNPRFAFDTVAGRYLVLAFVGSGQEPAFQTVIQNLAAAAAFDDTLASLFLVTTDPDGAKPNHLPLRIPGVRTFFDDDGAIAKAYGIARFGAGPVTVLISPRLQVLAIVDLADPEQHARQVLALLSRWPAPFQLSPALAHAPVLIIPGILEPALCRALIAGYERHGGRESGFMRDVDGRTVEIQDPSHKVRRDWDIEDEKLTSVLQDRFRRRVVPEIRKAFQFEVTRMERYLVACYAAEEGGHFRAHRDNTTKGTAHRRFAVSVNLNADEYEGGDLRLPEFGPRTYRAPTGGGVVFSCSLLHEATPVTRGKRYAFLPFLYDEAARKIREANLHHLEAPAASPSG
jgi:predicted 2-oxoglutarate/Fe(II)-dependent dioxygenase YbiX/peroxiredoxin